MEQAAISETAQQILAQDADPAVRWRLLRDVLKRPAADPELQAARMTLDANPHVGLLKAEQRADGGWGAFHSRNTRLKQKTAGTEAGVERALALGLDVAHPILKRARNYLGGLLADPAGFPDYAERNDRWATGVRLFIAGTLALVEPANPALAPVRELWIALLKQTFSSGDYAADAEIRAHRELTGATVKDSYLVIDNRYAAAILASRPQLLPAGLEQAYLKWLWHKPDGLGYLEEAVAAIPPSTHPGSLDRWLSSIELLARFPRWRKQAARAFDWLAEQQGDDGLWDLGSRGSASAFLPLSASWRRLLSRKHDWSTRVLLLLSQE